MSNARHNYFPGFPSKIEKSHWQFPTIINGYVYSLTGAEFKVLWYILRHTFGWQKTTDKLSLSQICNGIKKRSGEYLDKGTGLSRPWVVKALKTLEKKRFVSVKRVLGKSNEITLKITSEENELVKKVNQTSKESLPVTSKESLLTINNIPINNINNTKVLQKAYGNEDINFLIGYLKEKINLPQLDEPEKTNRQYCHLAIKKFGGLDKVRLLIDVASRSRFWHTKVTSFKTLYYNGVRIINETRDGGDVLDATSL